MSRRSALALGFICVFALSACSGTRPTNLGITASGLGDCPASPNCVSSTASDAEHRIDAYSVMGSVDDAWTALKAELDAFPRTVVVTENPNYIHAECTSAIMRYVDDVEFHLQPSQNAIGVRSASRIGHSDMGVNRDRIERIREALRTRGAVK